MGNGASEYNPKGRREAQAAMRRHLPHNDSSVEMRRAIQGLERNFFDESSDVDHDATTNFVAAEHVDHSAVSILAGTGLTGGGTLEANRTLALSHLGVEALADPGADRIAFWDETANAFKWLAVGTNLEIVDTDLNVTGIITDHGALTGLTPDDDHTQYFLADGTRDITGNFTFSPATHDFLIRHNSVSGGGNRGRIAIQCQTANEQMFVDLFAKDGDGTDDIGFTLYAKGLPTDITNRELLEFRYDATNVEFAMDIVIGGTGTTRPISIYASGMRPQLFIATNGNVGIKTTTAASALTVNGTVAATTVTGANVTTGADPGHTHTSGSVPAHDDLTGFVGAEHVDHSAVSISPGVGLSGGGTLEATRTLALDIHGLTAASPAVAADEFPFWDETAGTARKITFANLNSSLVAESLSTNLTAGSVVFSDGSNLSQDNANFFWDSGNARLGIRTTPNDAIHVKAASSVAYGGVTVWDTAAQAEGTGGGISFGGKYTTGGAYASLVAIMAEKTNGVTGDYGCGLAFYTRLYPSGAAARTMVLWSHGYLTVESAPQGATTIVSATAALIRGQYEGTGRATGTIGGFDAEAIIQSGAATGVTIRLRAGNYIIKNLDADTVVTNGVGLNVVTPENSGTLTNTVGIRIESQTIGTQTNTPFGISQLGASDYNYFAGKVGLNVLDPDVELEVNGEIHLAESILFDDLTADPTPAGGLVAIYQKAGDFMVYDDDDIVSTVKDIYGSMYADNVAETITVGLIDTSYEITAGFTTGAAIQGCTFGGAHYVEVDHAGTYLIVWSLSLDTATAADELEGGLMINGARQAAGTAHCFVPANSVSESFGGNAILALSADDEVSLFVQNHTAARDIVMEHGSLSVVRIGE